MHSDRSSLRNLLLAGVLASVPVGVVTAIGTLIVKPLYKSTLSFVPEASASRGPLSSLGRMGSVFGQLGLDVLNQEGASLAFYRHLARSEDVLSTVVNATIADSIGAPAQTLALMWYKRTKDENKRTFKTLKRFGSRRLTVTADERTGIVSVAVLAESPELAQWLAASIYEELNRYNVTVRRTTASAQRRFLEQQVGHAQDSLRAAEAELQSFYASNLLIRGDPRLVAEERQLTRKQDSWLEIYTTLVRELEATRVNEIRDTPVLNVIQQAHRPAYKDRPKRTRTTVLAALFAALVGVAVEFGRPWARSAFNRLRRAR